MTSYKSCEHYDKKAGKKKRKIVEDKDLCSHATDRRACRRCPQVPQYKLEEFQKAKDIKETTNNNQVEQK